MSEPFSFELLRGEEVGPRVGLVRTPHGRFATPAFMPVATLGAVRSAAPWEVRAAGAEIVLANTYHLYLRPGCDVVASLGGLHAFMGWDGPILTDSGGFQVFSLSHLRRVDDSGVLFRSHLDGSEHFFTPELAVWAQNQLGADIITCLDECPRSTDRGAVEAAVRRTGQWAERCLAAHARKDQALFGIVQGGVFPDLRRQSVNSLVRLGFPGYAIGGLSVGESKRETYEVVSLVCGLLPREKPRYLMGMGSPEDLVECVGRGVDMFDCVLPTRVARNGAAFVPEGRLNLRNARFARDERPILEGCDCTACRHFSRAYLRHLILSDEILGHRLVTLHNVRFYLRLMAEMRVAIVNGDFERFRREFLERFRPVDEEVRRKNVEARLRGLGR